MWPGGGEKRLELGPPQVSEPQVNDPRRRSLVHNEAREIGVLADDCQLVARGLAPQLLVGRTGPQ